MCYNDIDVLGCDKRGCNVKKVEAERMWRALSACVAKPGTRSPYDCVLVCNGIVYATDSYVIHRVTGLYDGSGAIFSYLHGNEVVSYELASKMLDRFFKDDVVKDPGKKTYQFGCEYFDSKLLDKALKPHMVFKDTLHIHAAHNSLGPLLIDSLHLDAGDHVIKIETVCAGKKVRK